MSKVLLGADPELFLHNAEGRYVPAFGLIGGEKDKPLPMEGLPEGFAWLEDNAAVEFNIPPQGSAENFIAAIDRAYRWIQRTMQERGYFITGSNVIQLDGKYVNDPRSKVIGCSPDCDAYKDGDHERDPFTPDTLGVYRYAGGHIHIQYNVDVLPAFVAARFLDMYLTLPFLAYDRQASRRTTYGKPGLFRPKQYGIEYRTPSNWWVFARPREKRLFANNAFTFASRSFDPKYLKLLSNAYATFPWRDLQRIVETEDRRLGNEMMDLINNHYRLGIQTPILL